MKAALVTGASSGIGEAISKALLTQGYQVYGIGRDFSSCPLTDISHFYPVEFSLTDTQKLPELIKGLRKKASFSLLVNNAGTAYFGLHEELNVKKIHEMVAVNLEAPLILTQLLLRDLKAAKGTVLFISSVTAKKSSPHGCAYGATKAGLSSFSKSLFDEVRKYGVRVITIHPDMTQTNLYRNADFKEGDTPDTYLLPEEIADAAIAALSARDGLVLTDITISPQRHQLGKHC